MNTGNFALLTACLMLLFASSTSQAAIFKCIGTDGSVTFSDKPCAASNEKQTTVNESRRSISSYSSGFDDGYQPEKFVKENQARSLRKSNSKNVPTEYIDIPDRPERPGSKLRTTVTGEPVIVTGSNTAIDPSTGQTVPIHISGHDPYKEYREANRQREIAIEAEKHRAKATRTSANPMLCAEYRMEVDSYNSRGKQRPSNRASREQRNSFYEREKSYKAQVDEKKRFLRQYCQ